MLLRHPWLQPLLKPPTITEEDEEGTEDAPEHETSAPGVIDKEVSQWVTGAIEWKRNGTMANKSKPALHAAPLDAVNSPTTETPES